MKKLVMTVAALSIASSAVAGVKFITSYRAPGVPAVSFAGQKVAAVLFTEDDDLRMSIEEALARELTDLGVTGVAAYRLVPKPAIGDREAVRGFFERAGVKGVVALRVLDVDQRKTWEPSMWVGASYGSWYDYWGYGWGPGMGYGYGVAVGPGSVRTDTTLSVEALVFRVEGGELVWAGMSETTNPKSAERYIKDLVTAMVKAMRSRGLITK